MISKNLLVTGSAGFIGGTFAYEALKRGYEVTGIDNFINGSEQNIRELEKFQNFKFFKLDLSTDTDQLTKIVDSQRPNSIIHFAGLKAVGESEQKQMLYWKNNVLSTLNLLELVKNKEINFIFSSSATVYGESKINPITEDASLGSCSTYGSTKLAQELLISDYSRAYSLKSISLRYFNPVGSHDDRKIIEEINNQPNNLMPRILRVAKEIDEKIFIFGNDYPTKDGTGERDYIHITDLVDGHFSALKKISSVKSGHHFFNLGTGFKTSVLNLIETFESVNNIKIPYLITSRRDGDVAICCADPSKANKILDWSAKKSIDDMCRDSWEGVKDNESR